MVFGRVFGGGDAQSDLLRLLEDAGFWFGEDGDDPTDRAALEERIKRQGAEALYTSRRLLHLDAEDLAEVGIGPALLRAGPHLTHRGARLTSFHEHPVGDDGDHRIELNGATYQAGDPARPEDAWGLATVAFFRMINDLLEANSATDRFYAVNGGHDLHGFFLPPQVFEALRGAAVRERDKPYTPDPVAPHFGGPA